MKKFFEHVRGALTALAVAALAMLPSEGALAQVVSSQPTNIVAGSSTDFGNGPLEMKLVQGNAFVGTALGSGVGSTSGASTTLTLTGTPAVPPCVGCIISGAGITSGTTVAAFNGTTTITLSAAMTVVASTALAWGAACPATVNGAGMTSVPIQASVGGDWPFYTQARICGYAPNGPGAAAMVFPIEAH